MNTTIDRTALEQRLHLIRVREQAVAEDKEALIADVRAVVQPIVDDNGWTETARLLGLGNGHGALVYRLVGQQKASNSFLAEVIVGLARLEERRP